MTSGALCRRYSCHPTSFIAVSASTPASLAIASACTTPATARARPSASYACSGLSVSICTGWPSLSVISSETISANGCRVHVASWRCPSLTRGPWAFRASIAGNTPNAQRIASRAAPWAPKASVFCKSGVRSWGFQSALGGREPAAETDVCGPEHAGGFAQGSSRKKVDRPSQRREMAENAVARRGASIALACVSYEP